MTTTRMMRVPRMRMWTMVKMHWLAVGYGCWLQLAATGWEWLWHDGMGCESDALQPAQKSIFEASKL